MDHKEILRRNKIPFAIQNGKIVIHCPKCGKGNIYQEFHIDPQTGNSECYKCGFKATFSELTELIALSTYTPQDSQPIAKAENPHTKIKLDFMSLSELYAHEFGEQDWIIKSLIPSETICMISGMPQNFKTWITLEMAKCVATGNPFLDKFETAQTPVLIINEEDHAKYLQKRFKSLSISDGTPIYVLSQAGVKVTDDKWLDPIIEFIKSNSVKLVIFDSFIRIHSLHENDAGDMAMVFDKLKSIIKLGATVMLTHHHRKEGLNSKSTSQSLRGSTDILAALDTHIAVERKDAEISVYQLKLRVDKQLEPFKIIIHELPEVGKIEFEYGGDLPEKEIAKEKAKPIIIQILTDCELTRTEVDTKVRDVLKIGKNVIGEALSELEANGEISTRIEKHNKKIYSLPAF